MLYCGRRGGSRANQQNAGCLRKMKRKKRKRSKMVMGKVRELGCKVIGFCTVLGVCSFGAWNGTCLFWLFAGCWRDALLRENRGKQGKPAKYMVCVE